VKPLERVLEGLRGVRENGSGWMALCPAHVDQEPSLSVKEGDDGRALVHCFAGCSVEEITAALGLRPKDLFERRNGHRNGHRGAHRNGYRKLVESYDYTDDEGRLVFQTVRFEPKGFSQRRPDGQGGWTWSLKGVEPVLYRLREVLEAVRSGEAVYVVEGERDADRLKALGLAATTCAMGAGKWRGRYSEALRGADVVILPDADKAGRDHAGQVAQSLRNKAASVKVLELPGLPDKGDVSDWLDDAGGTVGELVRLAREAPAWEPVEVSSPSSAYRGNDGDDTLQPALAVKRFRDLPKVNGPRPSVVAGLFPARFPTTIYGDGGSAKSLLALSLLQAVASGAPGWFGHQIERARACLYVDFELDEEEQSRRALQLARGEGYEDSPENIYYLCAAGRPTREVLQAALSACEEHGIEVVALDSTGVALEGDAERGRDVIAFFRDLDRFRAADVSVLLVDHQSKLGAGESYQAKTAYGSVYKGNLSRSRIQVEAKDRGEGTLSVVMRQNKTNFGALADPFRVKLTFGEEQITMEREELEVEELREELTLNAADRVLLALRDRPAYPHDLCEPTGLKLGTVKNTLTGLRREGLVEDTGETEGQARKVGLTDAGERRVRGYLDGRGKVSSPSLPLSDDDGDDTADSSTNGSRRPTEVEARKVQRLIHEGTSPEIARREVLGGS
jgi:hypothetical protein